jgi:hypothetical protein
LVQTGHAVIESLALRRVEAHSCRSAARAAKK